MLEYFVGNQQKIRGVMKFIFVRHGETESNKLKRLMGQRIDESLNEAGLNQARELANQL